MCRRLDYVISLFSLSLLRAPAQQGCLSRYETRWAQLLASLDRRATSVREACGDSIEIQRAVETRVDTLVSRWSQLTEPHLDLDDNSDHPQDPNPRIFFPSMQHQNTVQVCNQFFKNRTTFIVNYLSSLLPPKQILH